MYKKDHFYTNLGEDVQNSFDGYIRIGQQKLKVISTAMNGPQMKIDNAEARTEVLKKQVEELEQAPKFIVDAIFHPLDEDVGNPVPVLISHADDYKKEAFYLKLDDHLKQFFNKLIQDGREQRDIRVDIAKHDAYLEKNLQINFLRETEKQNRVQFKNNFAYSFGVWLCTNLGKKDDATKYPDAEITVETNQKINELRKETFEKLTLVAQTLANNGVEKRTEYLNHDNKDLENIVKKQRNWSDQLNQKIARLRIENNNLYSENNKLKNGMKKSISLNDLTQLNDINYIANFNKDEKNKENEIPVNVSMLTSGSFTKIGHGLNPNEEARVTVYDESTDALSEKNILASIP